MLPDSRPPWLAVYILQLLLQRADEALFLGDLEEEYADRLDEHGFFHANAWYWGETCRSLWPVLRDRLRAQSRLLRQSLETGVRLWKKEKRFGIIQAISLALGLAVSVLVLSWARFELSYDRFLENDQNLYRIIHHSDGRSYPISPGGLAPAIADELPEISQVLRMSPANENLLNTQKGRFRAWGALADTNFFSFFSFPLIEGNPAQVLRMPRSLVITEEAAQMALQPPPYVGQTVTLMNDSVYTVTGVMADLPAATHLDFDYLLSFDHHVPEHLKGWASMAWTTYIALHPDADRTEVESKITAISQKHEGGRVIHQTLQPVVDIHLRSTGFQWDSHSQGDAKRVWLFMAAALAILLMASINAVNLNWVRTWVKQRDLAMRRTLGARTVHLLLHSAGQAAAGSLLTVGLAVLLIRLFENQWGIMTGHTAEMKLYLSAGPLSAAMGLGFLLCLLIHVLPIVWVLAVGDIRSGRITLTLARGRIRQGTVVFQIAVSVVLVLIAFFISRQMHFMQDYPLGVNLDGVYRMRLLPGMPEVSEIIRQELLQQPSVTAVTTGHTPIVHGAGIAPDWEGKQPADRVIMYHAAVDCDYADFYGLDMAAGHFFSSGQGRHVPGFVINEAAARHLGGNDALGKWLTIGTRREPVIAVVKDFRYRSLRYPVQPFVFYLRQEGEHPYQITFRAAEGRAEDAAQSAAAVFRRHSGGISPQIYSVRQELAGRYLSDSRMQAVFEGFAVLAAAVAALGIFGLAAYSAQRRQHEVVVKRVLGAGTGQLMGEMLREYVLRSLTAVVLALFPALWYTREWLSQFDQRLDVTALPFVGVALGTVLLVTAVASYWMVRTLRISPAAVLRDE